MKLFNSPNSVTLNQSDEEVVSDLYQLIATIAREFQTEKGLVNYRLLQEKDYLQRFSSLSNRFPSLSPETWSEARTLSFWLNTYTMLTIHQVLLDGVRHHIRAINGFFNKNGYMVGRYPYHLDDIEHGVLRVNHSYVGHLSSIWSRSDPRNRHALTKVDFRIHFAFFCGTLSSSRIRGFEEPRVNQQLTEATSEYLNEHLVIDSVNHRVLVPKAMDWYNRDFGRPQHLLELIKPYLSSNKQELLARLGVNVQVGFLNYNWDLNSLS